MAVDVGDSKLTIITKPKNFHYDLPKDIDNNLEHEIDYIIRHNKLLTKLAIKSKISQLLSKHKHGNNVYEHGKQ